MSPQDDRFSKPPIESTYSLATFIISEYDTPFPKHIKEIEELLKLQNKYSKELEDEDEELKRLSNLNRIEKQIKELIDSYRVAK